MTAKSGRSILLGLHRYAESWINGPYIFARHGAQVDVVVPQWHPLKHSKWVRKAYLTDGSDADFARLVCDRLRTGEYQFLHTCDEPARKALYSSPQVGEIADFLQLHPDSELAKTFGRKDLFFDWCKAHGVPFPFTAKVSSWEETLPAVESLGWPCMIKRIDGSGGKNSVFVLRSAGEARQTVEAIQGMGDRAWLVQAFIEGITGSASFFAAHGRVLAWFSTTKLASLAGGYGPQVMSGFTNNPRLEPMCMVCAQAGPVHGITGFDFIETKNGECYVIDPHFGRSLTTLHMAPLCGVDFGRAVNDWLEGKPHFSRPVATDLIGVKYPEIIRFASEGQLGRVLREAFPLNPKVRYFLGPKGDWRMISRMTLAKLAEVLQIKTGNLWKRLRGSGPQPR